MPGQRNRRPRGTGTIVEKHGAFYGQWRVRGELTFRKLGPVRQPDSRNGLTRTMAEARLRELMTETANAPPPVIDRMTIEEVGSRRIKHLIRKGRKRDTTLANYESEIRIHFVPFFERTPITAITAEDVEKFIDDRLGDGLAVKTVRNLYVHLNGIFEFAIKKRWAYSNPCREVEKPTSEGDDDQEIRFLDQSELDALIASAARGPCRHTPTTLTRAAQARVLRDFDRLAWKEVARRLGCSPATAMYLYRATEESVTDDDLCRVDRVLYLAAAMTGLRQGELLALRWRDIDWTAQKIRVARNVRGGKFRPPKSKGSSRSVPMADVVGGELERLFQASAYQADDELVFGHPRTGRPLERGQVTKRFKRTLKRAGVREVRFHDLRHTFGTRCAANGVPMRTLQEWMGHADIKTTLIYTHYAPSENEVSMVNQAFGGAVIKPVIKLSATQLNSAPENPDRTDVEQ
jgi:integrase